MHNIRYFIRHYLGENKTFPNVLEVVNREIYNLAFWSCSSSAISQCTTVRLKRMMNRLRCFVQWQRRIASLATPHIFCTLANWQGSEKRLSEAFEVFEQSKESGFEPEPFLVQIIYISLVIWHGLKINNAQRIISITSITRLKNRDRVSFNQHSCV